MTERSNVRKFGPLPDAEGPSYEVGYGKPPVETRFKPGQSGNPRGRPKGSKSRIDSTSAKDHERLKQVIVDEAYRQITIRDGDRFVEMPVIQAVVRNMALNAAKGDKRSQRMLTDLLKTIEGERKALADEYVKTMIEYKIEWEQRLEERDRHGLSGPKPYPHPDDIVLNFATSEVEIRGPMSKEEDDYMDKYLLKADVERQIADLEKKSAGKAKSNAAQGRLTTLRSLLDRMSRTSPATLDRAGSRLRPCPNQA